MKYIKEYLCDGKTPSNKELIKWVEAQQRINEDPNYGIGNWA